MQVSKLLNAASYKLNEQAREGMAEADMGGGRFDDDICNIRRRWLPAASTVRRWLATNARRVAGAVQQAVLNSLEICTSCSGLVG